MGQNLANQIIAGLEKSASRRPSQFKLDKPKGVKLIGYTGRFVPEELIYAVGAKPFLICRGGEAEPTEAVLPYMIRVINPFARAQLGYHLLGLDPVLPMLDLIISQVDDCHMARLTDLMEYLKLPTIRLGVPNDWEKELSLEYYYKGLVKVKKNLENLTGVSLLNENLKAAIKSINAVRTALKDISQLRKSLFPPLGGYDFIRLNHYSFYCDLEEYVSRLIELHVQLQKTESPFSEVTPRILFMGRVVAVGDYVVPKLIEDSGGMIAYEMLDEGLRHCEWNVSTEGDLIANLTKTYFIERTPPSIFQPAWRKRIESMKRIIEEYRIEGVVWYQLLYDEIYDMEYAVVAKEMERINMPVLRLESSYEYAREATGPLKTRVESFLWQLKQRKEREKWKEISMLNS